MPNALATAVVLAALLVGAAPGCVNAAEGDPGAAVTAPPPTVPPRPTPRPRPESPASRPVAANPVLAAIHAQFGAVLGRVVDSRGLVRYGMLDRSTNSSELRAVVEAYATVGLPDDRRERLALWSNAYNANVLHMMLAEWQRPGFRDVTKVPGFFDKRPIRVAGETLTLNDLENQRVRKLGDARIHAALVCAAMSCPPLRAEAYTADRIDAQLDDQCKRWVNDPTKFSVEDGAVLASEILKWYGEDFKSPPYGDPAGFVLAYATPGSPLAMTLVRMERPTLAWMPYDWTLNRAPDDR